MNKINVEICCASLSDCKTAELCGANAIELVSAHLLGGLTPSQGLLQKVKEQVSLPIHVMVRPRGAGFCYSQDDFEVMCMDADNFVKINADAIVFGFLMADGNLDYERCARFLEHTGDCDKVFHRAIDVTPNPLKTAEKLVSLGIKRILTSGGQSDALKGAQVIHALVSEFGNKIQIMAGGGVRASNIREIIMQTGVSFIHLAGTALQSDSSTHCNPLLDFGAQSPTQHDSFPAVSKEIITELLNIKDFLL